MTAVDFSLLAKAGSVSRTYKAGDVIFHEGDVADVLYVIEEGSVEIRLGNRLLATLGKNEIFGEMALIDHAPRSATAVAVADTILSPVGQRQFLFMVSETPHFALNVMHALAERLRETNHAL